MSKTTMANDRVADITHGITHALKQLLRPGHISAACGLLSVLVSAEARALPVFGEGVATSVNGLYTLDNTPNYQDPVSMSVGNSGTVSSPMYLRQGLASTTVAARWDASGSAVMLGGLGGNPALLHSTGPNGVSVGSAPKPNSQTTNDTRAVRWSAGSTTATELGTLGLSYYGSTNSGAFAANTSGTVVGESSLYNKQNPMGYSAVRWDAGGVTATELGHLGTSASGFVGSADDGSVSVARAINTFGTAVGSDVKYDSSRNVIGTRAVRWDAGGVAATELGNLGVTLTDLYPYGLGGTTSSAYAINDAGTIIGTAQKFSATGANLGIRAVRWDAGGTAATELGTVGVATNGTSESRAFVINAAGDAVGYSLKHVGNDGPDGQGRVPVRWSADSTAATQLTLAGALQSGGAESINSRGAVAGFMAFPLNHAVVWLPDNTGIDLNSLLPANSGWTRLTNAESISDTGWVAGHGIYDPDGAGVGQAAYVRFFLMLVPQAGTYGLGDANFDTNVDFNDLLLLAKNYNLTNSAQATNVADFDLNGVTDFNDLLTLAKHYNGSAAGLADVTSDSFAADFALAQSLVPEPTAIAGIATGAGLMRRRQPQRSR